MIPWRLFPIVRVFFAFLFGVILERHLPNCFLLFASLGLISISFLMSVELGFINMAKAELATSIQILILFACLGFLRAIICVPGFGNTHFSNYVDRYDSGIGVIQEIPIKRTSLRTELSICYLCNTNGKKCISVNGNAVIYFKQSDSTAQQYKPGDKIYFKGRLKEISSNTNPFSFDFKLYLYNRGITHQVYVWDKINHLKISHDCLPFIYQNAMKVRDNFVSILKKYDKNNERFAVSSAMILGYKNLVSEDMYKAFSDSGAVHILAVSGMHLGVLASALSFFIDKWKTKRKSLIIFKYIFILSILWFFAFITGAAPAMTRAAIMFTFILYAKYFKPNANFYNILALCGLLMLVYDPFMAYQASFQFSFLAILSLVYFQPFVKNWYVPKNVFTKVIWELTSVAIAAQVLVVPITIYFFHKFPLYFILTGVASVWFSTMALYSGLILFVMEYLYSPINILVSKIFLFLMDMFILSVKIVKEIPFCSIDGLVLSEIELLLCYLILVTLMFYLLSKRFYLLKIISVIFGLIVFNIGYKIHKANHQLLFTIYDNRNFNQIDVFDGRHAIDISFDTIKNSMNSFINQNNRIYHNINRISTFNKTSEFTGTNCRLSNQIIQFKDKNLVIVDNNNFQINMVKYEYVFLTENIQVKDELKFNKNAVIIADRSMEKENINLWKQKAKIHGLRFHSIKNDGSITIKIIE